MTWFAKHLHRKFILATIVGFLISSLVFLGLFLTFYQSELSRERAQAAKEVNFLLQSSLENAMLKRDLNGLVTIVTSLGNQSNIKSVMIANPAGRVRFSSHPERLDLILSDNLIQLSDPHTFFLQDEFGSEVLRSVNPVHNKPQCKECHQSIETNPINGILVVDYNASSIKHKVRNTTLVLMGAGALIVIINLIGGWWFIRRFILRPVESLSDASKSLGDGQLDTRVAVTGQNELSELAHRFNSMAAKLQKNMRQLEEGKAFLHAMVNAIPDGLRIVDQDYNMLLVNQMFCQQTGQPKKNWIGKKCYQATYNLDEPCPSELVTCPLEEIQKNGKAIKLIHHHTQASGDSLDVEIYAAPMTFEKDGQEITVMVESIRDLTKLVRFTHEQRLSELGRLAAGVAHEIYNPLSSMKFALSALTQMNQNKGNPEEIEDYLNIMGREMEQCIQITDRLLQLSAAPLEQPQLVDIQQVVKDILLLVQWDAKESNIILKESFPDTPLRTMASNSELRMLALNLVQNAFHAMPDGGILEISGAIVGKFVEVRFKDTGVGIATNNLVKVFMPFFSRRADDVHGTGLGLPISRAIVQKYDGTLEVDSKIGAGSCFIVKIPAASAERLAS